MNDETALDTRATDVAVFNEQIAAAVHYAEGAAKVVVSGPESYEGAVRTLQELRTIAKELDEQRLTRGKPLLEQKRAIDDSYRPATDAIKKADYHLVSLTSKYRTEQEQARRLAEQEAAAKAERERQRAEAKAEEYREQGREDKAAEWETRAAYTPAPVVPSRVPATAGVSFRTIWKFEVVDAGKIPAKFLAPDLKRIGEAVDGLKDLAAETIPGIRVWSEEVPVTRRAS